MDCPGTRRIPGTTRAPCPGPCRRCPDAAYRSARSPGSPARSTPRQGTWFRSCGTRCRKPSSSLHCFPTNPGQLLAARRSRYDPGMRIVAILAARNESLYIRRCLQSLIANGLEVYVIDNDSEDGTAGIAREFIGKGVIDVERHPYLGSFDFVRMLEHKTAICGRIDADWFMHCDADEIRQAPAPYANLAEAVADVDRQGYNAINFDEFVFLPTAEHEHYENTDYVAEMRNYYFFDPKPLHRVNLW